jgi:hypothetical protein
MAADGITELAFERERHNAGTGKAEYWVKIPSVSATAPTTFFIYYGNAGATDGANPTAVWDANTVARWGLQENPVGPAPQMKDSTINANHGTAHGAMTSADSVKGQIGRALAFDGVDDFVEVPDHSSLDGHNEMTFSFWMKRSDNTHSVILAKARPGREYWINSSAGEILYALRQSWIPYPSGVFIPLNEWSHISLVVDPPATEARLYVNGTFRDAQIISNISFTNSPMNLRIGMQSPENGGGSHFTGSIDNIHISSTARSPSWIHASFNSANNTLLAVGLEENR